MTDKSDSFLDDLTAGLTPVRPMRAWPVWFAAVAGLLLGALYVIVAYGPRPEMVLLAAHGLWPIEFVVLGKPLLFLLIGLSALWGVAGLMRPEGRVRRRSLLPIAVLIAMVLIALVFQFAEVGPAKVMASLIGANVICILTIVIGGAIGLALLWALWLRQSATSHPVAMGALSGLATGSLMAAAYAIHCNMDAPIYILATYGFGVAAVTGVAAALGHRLFRW